ncbi:MAG TPA: ABC transporter permease [Pyrinomonadaceae bacterium]|nr:ABC transporter permease [Pyrinomonadaceae bacterium]
MGVTYRLRAARTRLRGLLMRNRVEREVDEELRFHLRMRAEENVRRGMTQDEAERAARASFGHWSRVKENCRDFKGGGVLEVLLKDVRFGARTLLKSRGFTLVAVMTLAIGIGANTAIFSVVNAVLLRPLPYRDPARLVTVLHDGGSPVAPANFLDWREQGRSFESIAAAQSWNVTMTGQDRPEQLNVLQTSAEMFRVLGVDARLGRTYASGEDQPGREHVVVISHGLWQRRFGGERSVVGREVMFDGEPYTIVGVMPPDFQFAPFWATHAEAWLPLNLGPRVGDRRGQSLRVFARLKPGVTREQAQAEMETINGRLKEQHPRENEGLAVSVDSLHERVVGKSRPALLIMLGAVGFVLLIACANVANLLLAKAASRRREIAVRIALGAGRWRVVRQLLTESLMLSLAGGAAGLLLASWSNTALASLGPDTIPRVRSAGLDARVVVFTLGLSVFVGILFGLVPALRSTKTDLTESLKDRTRGPSHDRRSERVRQLLVVGEVAVSLVLLVGGGLMMRSFLRLTSVAPGFDPRGVLTATVPLSGPRYSTDEQRAAFFRQLTERLGALPGVKSASAVNHLPLGGDVWTLGLTIEGRPAPPDSERPSAVYRVARPEYFRTMGAPLLKGRDFTERDDDAAPGVVIVNEALARRHWPNEDALGKRITVSGEGSKPREVVGVVRDLKQGDWASAPKPEMYLPHAQAASPRSMTLVMRAASDPSELAPEVRREVWALDKDLPVSQIISMDDVVADSVGQQRFNTLLIGVFAASALILAAVGVYGVMSHAVAQRTHEIGVRMALGARGRDVLGMVLRQGLVLTLSGLAVGLVGAFALTRVLDSILYEVSATDPVVFGGMAAALTLSALLACYVPARRATKVDPMEALRYD